MAGFSRRFDPSYRNAAQKILSNNAIGTPFMVRSNTCDLLDTTGFFVRYASRNGGIFVDCAIHDIDLSLWYLGNPVPKACWAVGTLQHHPELKQYGDVGAYLHLPFPTLKSSANRVIRQRRWRRRILRRQDCLLLLLPHPSSWPRCHHRDYGYFG